MKFTANVEALRNALRIVTMSIPTKTIIPIEECMLIDADGDSIKFTCSDMQMQVSFTVEGQVDEPGRCAVRGKLFEDVIKKMPDGDVVVRMDGSKKPMVIAAGRTKSTLSCMDADTFPIKEDFEATTTIRIDSSCLLEMISDTEACISRGDAREVLTGGCIDVEKCVVRMAALDGFRLAVKGYSCSCETDMHAIIPVRSLMVLKKLLSMDDNQLVEMEFNDKCFGMTLGNANIVSTLISGEFVAWRQIVPKTYHTTIRLSASDLKSAIDRAFIVAKSGANNLVHLDIADDTMRVYAKSDLDEMYDVIDGEHEGEPIKIAFNVIYLNDLLKVFNDGDIILKLVGSISPMVVQYADMPDDALRDFFWLILPVRQQSQA